MANNQTITLITFLLISSIYKLVTSDHVRSFSCLKINETSISYQSNLNFLLSDFNSQSSQIGFYNTSIGNNPDKVYGYYMCRGDFKPETCQTCIINATEFVQGSACLRQKQAGFLSSDCIFRYSNQSMHGVYDDVMGINSALGWNMSETNQTNYTLYNRTLNTMIDELIEEASSSRNDDGTMMSGFATKEVNVTDSQKIYGLGQCTPDIDGVNCSRCLRNGFSNLQTSFSGYEGAEYATYNCLLMYNSQKLDDNGDVTSNGKSLRPTNLVVFYLVLVMFVYNTYFGLG